MADRTPKPCGTDAAYCRGCKCVECKAAHAAAVRWRKAHPTGRKYRGVAEHGTRSKYVRGCRCAPCRKSACVYALQRKRAAGVLPAVRYADEAARSEARRVSQQRYYQSNVEHVRAQARVYAARKRREQGMALARVAEHGVGRSLYVRGCRCAPCVEAARAYARARRAKNPEAARKADAAVRTYRANGSLTAEDREYVAIIAHDPCVYCGGPSGTTDHVEAIKQGGSLHWENFAPACRSCNARKWKFGLLHYLLRRNAS